MAQKSIWSRKADLAYLVFFIIHLPIMFLVDLTSFYPQAVHAALPIFGKIRSYYATTYKDRFFSAAAAPPWFRVFILLEAIYHVPLSLWAIWALSSDHHQVPLQLLVFALEAALTTLPCLVEVATWPELLGDERARLLAMYGAYLGVSVAMGIDCLGRVRRTLHRDAEMQAVSKGR